MYERRWSEAMLPAVPVSLWRKSSQWVMLTRPHAELVAEDTLLFEVFNRTCWPYVESEQRFAPSCLCACLIMPI